LFWPSLISHRENSFRAVHRCTERKAARGYDEMSELLEPKETKDKEDSSWFPTSERQSLFSLLPSVTKIVSASCRDQVAAATAPQSVPCDASDRRALASVLSVRSVVNSYFGAREATIFSKHGSPRTGSHHGISFSSP